MANDEGRMAHHVVEHATTLERSPPEPGRMRPAVLLRCTREIWAACRRRAASPNELVARLHLGSEELILQIARGDADALDQLHDLLRLGDVPRQRLLARDPLELPFFLFDRGDDLLDVLETRVVGPRQPDRIDGGR